MKGARHSFRPRDSAPQGHGKVDVIAHRRMEFSGYGAKKSSEEDSIR
jgi:hypothetical protein